MKYPLFIGRKSTLQDPLLCAHDAILRDRLSEFLRERHPSNTAKEVSRKARVPHRTVERWLAGLSSPRLEHFISLLAAYGPALLEAAMKADEAAALRQQGFDWVKQLQVAEDSERAEADLTRVANALKALQGGKQ